MSTTDLPTRSRRKPLLHAVVISLVSTVMLALPADRAAAGPPMFSNAFLGNLYFTGSAGNGPDMPCLAPATPVRGAPLIQVACEDQGALRASMDYPSGSVRLSNNLCLSVYYAQVQPGTAVVQGSCTDAVKWVYRLRSDGTTTTPKTFALSMYGTGQCMTGYAIANGQGQYPLSIQPCNDQAANQNFRAAAGGTLVLKSNPPFYAYSRLSTGQDAFGRPGPSLPMSGWTDIEHFVIAGHYEATYSIDNRDYTYGVECPSPSSGGDATSGFVWTCTYDWYWQTIKMTFDINPGTALTKFVGPAFTPRQG